jgi:hypothetical protein
MWNNMIKKGDTVTLFMAGNCYKEELTSSDLRPVKCLVTGVKTDLRGVTLYGFESVDPKIIWIGKTEEQFIWESDKFAEDIDLIDKEHESALRLSLKERQL